jgi:hypothetical protein
MYHINGGRRTGAGAPAKKGAGKTGPGLAQHKYARNTRSLALVTITTTIKKR